METEKKYLGNGIEIIKVEEVKCMKFLGIGSAFNTELGNTSAFLRRGESMILIDCGGTVFHKLNELGALEGIKNLHIVITHTHPDHVGSLGEVIFYSYYLLKTTPIIYFPDGDIMRTFLSSVGVREERYILKDSFSQDVVDEKFGEFFIEFLRVPHVDTIPSYGFILKLQDETIYYSGDSRDIDEGIIESAERGEIHKIYQDTCGLDYENNNHMCFRVLKERIPLSLRSKIYCMHLDKFITSEEIEAEGFNVAVMSS